MSIDIWCVCPTCGACPTGANITHNVQPQIAEAGADPWEYDGRLVAGTLGELRAALAVLEDPAQKKPVHVLRRKKADGKIVWRKVYGVRVVDENDWKVRYAVLETKGPAE